MYIELSELTCKPLIEMAQALEKQGYGTLAWVIESDRIEILYDYSGENYYDFYLGFKDGDSMVCEYIKDGEGYDSTINRARLGLQFQI